ncbi:MAG: OmpA family protein [Flavobacterium sp.]|uniref:OmpA family protein n=1 Tax=Flavobacterium sp. TaxID=239 RepID=UPI00261AB780|nr:OmpA family protein [Flavobacterium sp.]MDD5149215.1 OmpA family protein [Flavobacterium sp.]
MKNSTLIYSLFFSLISLYGYSQKAKVAEANKQYEQYAYVDAITIYERVAEKGYKDEQLFQKLGNAYYFNAELEKAAKWYGELFAMNPEQVPEYYYRYSQALKSLGDYTNADKMLEQFNVKSGNDQRAKLYLTHKNYLEEIKANSGRFDIANAGINSELSDFGSSFFQNKIIFASSREVRGISKKISKRTNQPFTNLFGSERYADGTLEEPKIFGDKINDKFNESTPVFTKDGNTMYFTRNNYLDGKRGEDAQKTTLLKIYKATLEEGKWSNIIELPFNSDQYSVAHPALSTDGKTLYFASDMPGTIGQSDLFKVTINEDGSFGTPGNLGNRINTEGKETFPFISEENELYFASDGRPGLGGLDIFVSKIEKDNGFKEIQNVGAPVNGPQDDFAFIIDSKSRNGFFTSNRDGGKGFDDIYRFTETLKLGCNQELTGIITDQDTGEVLTDYKVSLFDENFQLVKEYIVQGKGLYSFDVECGKNYYVRAQKLDFETNENNVTTGKSTGKTYLNLSLERRIKPIGVGTDLAKTVNIPIIYFDLDKWNIRPDAAFQLEKVAEVMKQFPAMKIDVRSHTDSRQTAQYNLNLSNKRAKSTMQWLVKKGIDASRLTSKGYGETQLVNGCSDGVNCTGEEHQANRRSEFIIMSMK